MQVSKKELVTV